MPTTVTWSLICSMNAESILAAIPITFLFFVPLLLAERLGLSFWFAYAAGCALLPVGFLVHSALGRFIRA